MTEKQTQGYEIKAAGAGDVAGMFAEFMTGFEEFKVERTAGQFTVDGLTGLVTLTSARPWVQA